MAYLGALCDLEIARGKEELWREVLLIVAVVILLLGAVGFGVGISHVTLPGLLTALGLVYVHRDKNESRHFSSSFSKKCFDLSK
jgi:hypothetical protein